MMIIGIIVILSILTLFSYIFLGPSLKSVYIHSDTSINSITISGIGIFQYDSNKIISIRPAIFRNGHFSVFDILVYLNNQEEIDLKYHFDEEMNTHVIESINGKEHWWYEAHYDGGWSENNVFRMDHYPYKDQMSIKFFQTKPSLLNDIHQAFREEIQRKNDNNGKVIIPNVIIRGTQETLRFQDVEVHAHNLRNDMFQDEVITAIDVIQTLGDNGHLTYDLDWFESIGSAKIVKDYFIVRINNDHSVGRCGFVYEEGSEKYDGFLGNHIHLPADIRVINSPEYEEWFWICI
jgi:hypothetical protein